MDRCDGGTEELEIDEELSINGILLLDDDYTSNMMPIQQYEEACQEIRDT